MIRWLWVASVAIALAASASASAQDAGVRLTLNPTMIKGPVTARVTIVEFSDYQ
jgi:protein-disulfide isomerase